MVIANPLVRGGDFFHKVFKKVNFEYNYINLSFT